MTTSETIILVSIFALCAALIALPRVLGRRERRRRAATDELDASEPSAFEPDDPNPDDPNPDDPGAGDEAPRRRRLRDRLGKSRAPFAGMRARMRDRGLDDEAWDDLEETLLLADVGMPTTTRLLDALRGRVATHGIEDGEALTDMLGEVIASELDGSVDRALAYGDAGPAVWLLVGVNGAGKTTTAAKLATRALADGRSVLFAASDTFRAAATDQLAHWGATLGVDMIRGAEGADPGAVAFDAVQAAQARGIDLVLVDTAGRLHTKVNLMEELKKVRRVIERTPDVLREVLLVLDATTGQNGLAQAREFTDAMGVTGVVLTKLDGSAKGGVVLAIESELGVPVKLVGVGESADDLVPFDLAEFAAALVG
ncbi:MAG TPA: signal recognition particle-docking protein FtsY [Acidimicrobiia bacterium]|nr:signal recognition particle-docking protein FtsY [Acidimicrobiia bacterium]